MEWCDKELPPKFSLIYTEWSIFIEKRENSTFFFILKALQCVLICICSSSLLKQYPLFPINWLRVAKESFSVKPHTPFQNSESELA